jgi:hypothetical protein
MMLDFEGCLTQVAERRVAAAQVVKELDVDVEVGAGLRPCRICGAHAGGRFDGMIDLAFSVRHVIYKDAGGIKRPMLLASDGTEGSRG